MNNKELIFCGHPIFDFDKCPLQKSRDCERCFFSNTAEELENLKKEIE